MGRGDARRASGSRTRAASARSTTRTAGSARPGSSSGCATREASRSASGARSRTSSSTTRGSALAPLGLRRRVPADRLPEVLHGRHARLADRAADRRHRRRDHEPRGARGDHPRAAPSAAGRSASTRSATRRTGTRSTRSRRRVTHGSTQGLRQRIEHAQCLATGGLPRFAELGIACSVQFSHAPSDRDLAERLWAERLDGTYSFRSLLDSGALLANGSDAPVEELDPLAGIAAGVLRSIDERPAWRPEEALTVEQALTRPASRRPGSRATSGAAAGYSRAFSPTSSCSTATRSRSSRRSYATCRWSRRWSAAAGCTTLRPGTEPTRLRSAPPRPGELDEHRRCGGHVLHARPLPARVVLGAAGEEIRRRQAAVREAGAVGAAADDRVHGLDPDRRTASSAASITSGCWSITSPMFRYCSSSLISTDARGSRSRTSSASRRISARCSSIFAASWSRDDELDRAPPRRRLRSRAGGRSPPAPPCLGREPVAREAGDEVGGELDRVHELPLRRAGMRRAAADRDVDLGGVERLRLDLAELGAVERVGVLRPEPLEVEVLGAACDLLVDGEADADRRVRELRIALQVRDRGHDLRDTGLVVGAEQRRAVGRDDVVADLLRRAAAAPPGRATTLGSPESSIAPPSYPSCTCGSTPVAGDVRRSVDMRDQPDRWRRPRAPGSEP